MSQVFKILSILSLLISLLCAASPDNTGYNPIKVRVGHVQNDITIVSKKKGDGSQHVRYMVAPKPPLNIGYLGRGYNIIYGNVMETTMGGDKGIRRPVFLMEANDDRMSPDWRHIIPVHVDVQERVSCSSKLSFTEVSTSAALQEAYASSMTESSAAGLGGSGDSMSVVAKSKWGGSETFHNSESKLESGSKTIVFAEAECSVYQASLNLLLLPQFDPSFKKAVDALPAKYDSNAQRLYRLFIDTYGTHVVSSVLMGARYGKEYVMDKKELKDIEASGRRSATNSGGEGGFTSEVATVTTNVDLENSVDKTRSKEKMIADNAEDEKIFSIGAPYNDDAHEWAAGAGKDPLPIRIELTSLQMLVAEFVDATKGRNLASALSEYKPVGVSETTPKFGKCYQTEDTHLIFKSYVRKTSLIARCKPGDKVLGGSFVHLWNYNGDVHVDTIRSTAKAIMDDLHAYHKVRNALSEAQYFLKHGAAMLKQYANARTKDSQGETFGKRVDPALTEKFLNGEISDLGIQQEELVRKVHNAMKLFAGTPLEKIARDILSENPYLKSVMEVSKGLVDDIQQEEKADEEAKKQKELAEEEGIKGETVVLSTSGATLTFPKSLNYANADRTRPLDTLLEVFDALDEEKGHPREEAKSLYVDVLKDLGSKVVDGISDFVQNNPFGQKLMNSALEKFSRFTTTFDDIWAKFRNDANKDRQHIRSTPLFQHVLQKAKEDTDEHASTVLAERNSLNWLFPRHGNSWVCGSGVLGMKPTGHSSMGHCSALCCDSADWKFKDVMTREKTSNLEKRTSEIYSPCPPGEVVVSGGILISDYHEGRFVQVLASKPEGEGWKCKVEWSEENYVPYIPRFRCYARCASTPLGTVSCSSEKVSLINGHGTARCGSHQIAVSGGWDVQSNGITYLKKTAFVDSHPTEGTKAFRCELGTSHDTITGDCIARCCDINNDSAEKAVVEQKSSEIRPYWMRNHYTDIGSYLAFDQDLLPNQVIVSRNGNFFLRFKTMASRMEVLEEMGDYREPHVIGSHQFNSHGCDAVHFIFGAVFVKKEMSQLRLTKNGLSVIRTRDNNQCTTWEMMRDTVNRMQLDDNGDVTFYDDDGKVFQTLQYSECRMVYKKKKLSNALLQNGEMIFLGDGLISKNKIYMALFNMNGKFGIVRQIQGEYCHKPSVVWRSDNDKSEDYTAFTDGDVVEGWVLRLQEDNNLVILDDDSKEIWSTKTKDKGTGKAVLSLSNAGELELRDAIGTLLWGNVAGAATDCISLRERLKIRSHRAGDGVIFKPGEGGLVSKNNEYILYVRLDDNGKDGHLELWRSAGDDCKPVRICTLKSNVNEVKITTKGIYSGRKALFVFPYPEKMNELVLSDSGTLTAYGGPSHRREFESRVAMDCAGLGGVIHNSIPCTLESSFFGPEYVQMFGQGNVATGAWQECPTASFLRGWKQKASFPRTFAEVEAGICCGADKPVECINHEWPVDSLMHECPEGYVLSGFFVDGLMVNNLRRGKCCRYKRTEAEMKRRVVHCYMEGKWDALDKPGKTQCDREGHYIAGYRKSPCNHVYCVEEFKCCEP
eukprot:CAMPEP_0117442386 /NCGR_PEP_ID=MMETSP0759-20121206/4123_1 /TAXON_ID=63605 /ORGANISM="Percolomonas cosmopolitus, Strain WS" /LENGTH=1564 /DNA_ID=CAMNT_0005234269 /DNA_START=187 /DNA_END=4881 /DNA_ORIENTATION=-